MHRTFWNLPWIKSLAKPRAAFFALSLGLLTASSGFADLLTFSGSVTAGSAAIQLEQLIYFVTDGTDFQIGTGAMNVGCGATDTCTISATAFFLDTTAFSSNLMVYYTILGFYTGVGNSTPGPQPGDFSGSDVVSNPDIFGVTSTTWTPTSPSAESGFVQFFDPNQSDGFPGSSPDLEDFIATKLLNSGLLSPDSINVDLTNQMANADLAGIASPGQVWDFSDGTPNGAVTLSANLTTPEPSFAAILGAMLAGLLIWRIRRDAVA